MDTKNALISTAVFQRKAASECTAATFEMKKACEDAASERLFCSMLARHVDKFQGMLGVEAQKKICFETNIMETSLDAAKDAEELADSKNN